MKNLLQSIGINKLKELPYGLLSLKLTKKDYSGMYYYYRHYWDSDKSPYKIANRIIADNINKSFAEAFSYYCSKVEKRYQRIFLDEFNPNKRCSWWYYIDDNGLIQVYNPIKHKPVIFYSDNYKSEFKHWYYNIKMSDYNYDYKTKKYIWKHSNWYWTLPSHKKVPSHTANKSDFIKVIISGWEKEFESKNDYRFIRLTSEQHKRKIKARKLKYNTPKLSDEDFRRILKEKELKERQENLVKIISHGFDPVTSFRK